MFDVRLPFDCVAKGFLHHNLPGDIGAGVETIQFRFVEDLPQSTL